MTKAKTPVMDLETDEDGWIGGSSQSIYAPKSTPSTHASPPPPPSKPAGKPSPKTPARQKTKTREANPSSNSRSLLERMDLSQQQTPPPKPRNGESSTGQAETPSPATTSADTSPFRTTPSGGIRRPGAKLPSPLPLTSPARNNTAPNSPLNTRTPLSASHPIPETPLKLSQRGGPQTPATPHYPLHPRHLPPQQDGEAARTSGLGLGLTPLKSSVPLAPASDSGRSPLNEAVHLRGRAASNASIGSPLKQGRSDLQPEPLALSSGSSKDVRSAKLGSGLGTSASMWAPKPSSSASETSSDSSTSTTAHTIGSGFSASNLLGVQTSDRKRPGHRPNGLQLSLGQEISVMQELAEEDYPSSSNADQAFTITHPDNAMEGNEEGWNGVVVPPTPALGCDSPSSSDGGAAPGRSLDAFGWGKRERGKSGLFDLPSSSNLEANWSGDDDDEKKDDVEIFEDMQSRAKSSKHARAPPPINYKSRTPSPTHHMLAKSPQLDGPAGSPMLAASPSSRGEGRRLSGGSGRSQQMQDEDSDGDADAEAEADKSKSAKENLQVEAGGAGLEKKKSLKRDKSERIRGRRASQSKEDKIKPAALATVSLPKPVSTDEVADTLSKVTLDPATPAATRTQTIPTVKNDLFSSPAEPKIDLPRSPDLEEEEEKEEEKEKEKEKEKVEPIKHIDWAADDDDLDDELPDLDDWGVTLVPVPSAKPTAPAEPAPESQVWRKSAPSDAAGKTKGKTGPLEKQSKTSTKTSNGKAEMGIRIAGRAKEASLSPDPELPPPASTPYGRWNKASSPNPDEGTFKGSGARKAPPATTRPRVADLGALAKLIAPEQPSGKSRESSPALEGAKWEKKGAGDSMHAPPSVGDSMHAPKNRTTNQSGGGEKQRNGGGKKKPYNKK